MNTGTAKPPASTNIFEIKAALIRWSGSCETVVQLDICNDIKQTLIVDRSYLFSPMEQATALNDIDAAIEKKRAELTGGMIGLP